MPGTTVWPLTGIFRFARSCLGQQPAIIPAAHAFEDIKLMGAFGRYMRLAGVDDKFGWNVALPQGPVKTGRLTKWNTRIFLAMQN